MKITPTQSSLFYQGMPNRTPVRKPKSRHASASSSFRDMLHEKIAHQQRRSGSTSATSKNND